MTKYQINPDIVLRDTVSGLLVNRKTGEQFRVSDDAICLLGCFEQPQTINAVVEQIAADTSDHPGIRSFARKLVRQALLVKTSNENVTSKSVSNLADTALVSFPDHTFFGVPARQMGELESSSVCFVGVPYDLGTTGFPGTRFGPADIRRVSASQFDYSERINGGGAVGWRLNLSTNLCAAGLRIRDVGDVLQNLGEAPNAFHSRVTRTVKAILSKRCMPIVVGGDHSITYGICRAANEHFRAVGLIHLDAHTDLGEYCAQHCHHHGNYVTRLIQERLLHGVVQLGPRGNCGSKPDFDGYFAIPGNFAPDQIAAFSSSECKWHLSIDIDVLDPSIVPGTGTPVPGGWSLPMLIECVAECMRRFEIVSVDLVETNPMRDVREQSLHVASDVLMSLICHL